MAETRIWAETSRTCLVLQGEECANNLLNPSILVPLLTVGSSRNLKLNITCHFGVGHWQISLGKGLEAFSGSCSRFLWTRRKGCRLPRRSQRSRKVRPSQNMRPELTPQTIVVSRTGQSGLAGLSQMQAGQLTRRIPILKRSTVKRSSFIASGSKAKRLKLPALPRPSPRRMPSKALQALNPARPAVCQGLRGGRRCILLGVGG